MKKLRRQTRGTAVLLSAGAIILIFLATASTWISFRAEDTFDRILRDREIRQVAGDLLSSLQDIETGQRGFLLTDDATFLQPYNSGMSRMPGLRGQLNSLLDTHSPIADRADTIDSLIDRRLGIINATLELAQAGDLAGARARVMTGDGKEIMDQLRGQLGDVIGRADQRIDTAVATQKTLSSWMKIFSIIGAVALLFVVGMAFNVMMRQLRALRGAEIELQRLNAGLEERVAQRTEDLMRANQEVQRFAYIVTHDLRAPLVNIMGFTSELEASLKSLQAYVLADGERISPNDIQDARLAAAEDLPEAIGFIRASTRKMDGLINAILKISRDGRRELRPETVPLRPLIETAADSVAHQVMETGGEVTIDVTALDPVTDRLSIEQALGNLVDNAVKYSAPGRPLKLAIRARPEGRLMVRIEVQDNGRGIEKGDHERVFELFRRSGQQDKPGEGIGLAHVRSLMRNLGGEITVTSEPGRGSTFVLHVPADLRKVMEKVKA
ncbi:CHASE3 domain-containing protein [Frigidibacter sp. MR17.14]|uniref:sensor histidine kinase n=1 Tax=Frigidibacter sp. MR17.14 TaxID=3126509 RepID=UPI003012E661